MLVRLKKIYISKGEFFVTNKKDVPESTSFKLNFI